jgi:hypothetical protein
MGEKITAEAGAEARAHQLGRYCQLNQIDI